MPPTRGPSGASLDHAVGADEECRRHDDAEALRSAAIDDEFEGRGALDRQFPGLAPFSNLSMKTAARR
jgi:hypothetical protein